ncbi:MULTISPECIES: hypothetical protein [unclassified Pedobacter]|uniref:hypothetical protein n=1 Tax=unclassified Pedobacter TaxID=2628915 RepID=UPI001E3CA747|nr:MULTISPECIES: hypothetical protein [unclassified Pedobacter]
MKYQKRFGFENESWFFIGPSSPAVVPIFLMIGSRGFRKTCATKKDFHVIRFSWPGLLLR